jgi:hypothetical protein
MAQEAAKAGLPLLALRISPTQLLSSLINSNGIVQVGE